MLCSRTPAWLRERFSGSKWERFVRFVYDPGYVTANVGPVTLRFSGSPGHA